MRVLITGGAGYVGSHCNRCFAEHGVETVVLDNLSYGNKESVITGKFVKGDIGDKKLIGELFSAEKFDAVIHFAAFANIPESISHPARYYDNNVINMKILLDTAIEHGVKNIIFSSSAATYGETQVAPVEESHPQNPINPYGTTKLIGEMMLADYAIGYGLNYCAFRYFNVGGASPDSVIGEAHNPEHHLIPLVLRAVMKGEPLTVFGDDYQTRDGTCLRDYIHVVDLVEAHYLAMLHLISGGASGCFNLGSYSGFTVLEMINAAKEVVGKDIPYIIGERRPGDSPKLIASNRKAREQLGWDPKRCDVSVILRDAYNWELNRKF